MSNKANHYPVNWLDGMKINKNHFIDEANAFTQLVSNTIRTNINEYNYGLLPSINENNPVRIVIDLENSNTVYIKISNCKAITYGGYLIDIADNGDSPLSLSTQYPTLSTSIAGMMDTVFYIVLSVNPYKRIPAGDVNPEEEPLRYPYTVSEYKVHLISLSEFGKEALTNHLVIGKMSIQNGQVQLADAFIPPCTTLYSHPALVELHGRMNHILGKLEMNVISIIQKIVQKEQEHKLGQLVKYLAENILTYLNLNLYRFRRILKNQSPVELIDSIAMLAKTFKNTIDTRQGSGKEELLNYFVEWCNMNQGQFEGLMSEVIHTDYNHQDIRNNTDKCEKFLKEIDFLFQKLNELDYIGRKSDQGMIVKEELKTEHQKKTKNFFGI